MKSPKVKGLIIVSALVLFTAIMTVGCKQKTQEQAWVNTKSLPGQTFKQNTPVPAVHKNPKIIYLGAQRTPRDGNFGPKDVSFDFQDLK